MNTKHAEKNKVMLGLSGGVDSTAAVLLLQEKGYDVIGYHFDVTGRGDEGRRGALAAGEQLGIPVICEDVSEEFESIVIEDFCRQYMAGRTPNPCVICNPAVKFRKLMEAADREGAYYIATGHYASVVHSDSLDAFVIEKGADFRKDQSYMLYRLGRDVLSRLILPLGQIDSKDRVRRLVRENRVFNADSPDSQEICFIDDGISYRDYLKARGYSGEKGNFVDSNGNVLGEHQGVINYTVGQRKGLGIALGRPAFVVGIDSEKKTVTLGSNDDLFTDRVKASHTVFACEKFLRQAKSESGLKVKAKIRYGAKAADADVRLLQGGMTVTSFREPQRAVTPGQSIVFYVGDILAGGGIIE